MDRIKGLDWEAIAGIVAAVVALLLHLLQVVEQDVLLAVALVILALILLRELRTEARQERSLAVTERMLAEMLEIRTSLTAPDAVLVGPGHLREESQRFAQRAQGDMVWFNVCLLMFVRQSLFDSLLRPAVENPRVKTVQFILDNRERERWQTAVLPKLESCSGKDKVLEPMWATLNEAASFILTENDHGREEAHLSFWGEPFMSRSAGVDLPRYMFHVQPHSELMSRLTELSRRYMLASQ
ncbi:MAG TPA: hypothetical protein VJB57_19055 [Dehalococcoidia bacterium]|nr:hypothetical protein [Dehalococcoidia bacterium]